MIKKGDTLVEVTIAIGIFSLIAIAVASVMNSSTTGAQLALETTLAREEIDTQTEALRFIQNTYASSKESKEQNLSALWQTIADNAIDTKDVEESTLKQILQYAPTSCDELYSNSNPARDYAFVLNPRTINQGNEAYVSFKDHPDTFVPASTYPRLIFGDASNNTSATALDNNSASLTNLYRAEGVYAIAVLDPDSTRIIDITGNAGTPGNLNAKASAYIDFYVRTCWYGSGNEQPSTISTVIRLHDAGIISEIGWVKVIYHSATNPDNTLEDTQRGSVTLRNDPLDNREGYTFKGWCTQELVDGTCDEAHTKEPGGIIVNTDSSTTATYDLYEIWADERYTIIPQVNGVNIDSRITYCYPTSPDPSKHCKIPSVPTDLDYPGFKIQGWCRTQPPNDSTCSNSDLLTVGSNVDISEFDSQKKMYIHLGRTMDYLQDYTLGRCRNEARAQDRTLFDKRDDQKYTVRYIEERDKCWMTKDLSIFTDKSRGPGIEEGRIFADNSNFDHRGSWVLNQSSGTSFTLSQTRRRTFEGKTVYSYNFCAATTGHNGGCNSHYNTTNNNNLEDICPTGWRIPRGEEMEKARNNSGVRNKIFGTLSQYPSPTGWWTSQSLGNHGQNGRYMCALIYDTNNGNNLYFTDSGHITRCGDSTGFPRSRLFRVRCIHK